MIVTKFSFFIATFRVEMADKTEDGI